MIIKKIIPIIIIILLLIIIKNNISAIHTTLTNQNTAENLQIKLEKEKKENQYLKERLSYVKTNEFVRDEAQEKLGLLREGEQFIIAPTPAPLKNQSTVTDERSNWEKWWKLFF